MVEQARGLRGLDRVRELVSRHLFVYLFDLRWKAVADVSRDLFV